MSVRFTAVDYDRLDLDFRPMLPSCVMTDERGFHMNCDIGPSSSTAEQFMPKVVRCLAAAQFAPEFIEFGHALVPTDGWASRFRLDLLDLRKLKYMQIYPYMADPDSQEEIQGPHLALQQGIDEILQFGAATLEKLYCRPYPLTWGSSPPFALPKLRQLHLGPCQMDVESFSEWLAVLPKLTGVHVDEGYMMEATRRDPEADFEDRANVEDIKVILDVMRDHPTLKHGNMEVCIGGTLLMIRFDKDSLLRDALYPGPAPHFNDHDELFFNRYVELEDVLDDPIGLIALLAREYTGQGDERIMFYVCGKNDWFDRQYLRKSWSSLC